MSVSTEGSSVEYVFPVQSLYRCKTVMVHVKEICQEEETKKESEKTIIDVLMKAARSYDFFPEQRYVDFIKTIYNRA